MINLTGLYNVSHLLSGGCTLLKFEWKHLIRKLFVFLFVFLFVSYVFVGGSVGGWVVVGTPD